MAAVAVDVEDPAEERLAQLRTLRVECVAALAGLHDEFGGVGRVTVRAEVAFAHRG